MADVPENAISEKFLAGTGPGGQNVNKVATACQLRVDVYALGLQPYAFRQLKIFQSKLRRPKVNIQVNQHFRILKLPQNSLQTNDSIMNMDFERF